MANGSFNHQDRPKRVEAEEATKANVTSLRDARLITSPPRHTSRNAKYAAAPHWPGDTQAWPSLANVATTRAKFVGLRICLLSSRRRNLLKMASPAAPIARRSEFVRSSKQSDNPEMSALFGSKAGSFHSRVQKSCERRTPLRITPI